MGWATRSGATASDDRPRVAVVAHTVDDSGGMERVHAELIRRLLDRYRFVIVASKVANDLQERVDWLRVPVPSRPMPLRFLLFYGLGTVQVRRAGADLVHTCGALVPNRADVASVHFCHAGFVAANGRLAPEGSALPRRLNTALQRCLALEAERWSYRSGRLGLLAPVSQLVGEELRQAYCGVAVENTPIGVDLDRYRPNGAKRAGVRKEMGTDRAATVALFVGGDWDRKGLAYAIDALAIARATVDELELWVIGTGDESRFAARAVTAGVGRSVHFLGWRGDVERYYQGADIFLGCSSYEGFSLALVEAAASGLPLVTTEVGVAREMFDGSEEPCGLLVERRAQDLGTALAALGADPNRRTAYGRAARRRAERFSWDRLADGVDTIYRRLLETKTAT